MELAHHVVYFVMKNILVGTECELSLQLYYIFWISTNERKPTCPHPCPLPCHPGECPPCKALIKRSCHCGSMCTHLCPETCHPGECPSPDQCSKKLSVGSKVKAAEAELQHRKSKDSEVNLYNFLKCMSHLLKRNQKQRCVAEARTETRRRVPKTENPILQRIVAGIRRFLLFIIIMALIALIYLGYKGLLWLKGS
ncbi:hypothetical protein HAX54_017009 [Datura stramonium]|uniref:NF-X1-type domain-containing protein n=1 Tax=Datura stramonium TaxID=4076 RepID=A0ABS8S052_DATST|nr:hypothetical protein [Datura stramonium]